ncbi:MAG: hypothetical protein Tsb006_4340 [Rickettsiaceae bacterium]
MDATAKKRCITKLAEKYLTGVVSKDKAYIQAFQYEAEKLGFKQFLNKQGMPCQAIDDGPKFDQKVKAYVVKCKPAHQYLVRFDYSKVPAPTITTPAGT